VALLVVLVVSTSCSRIGQTGEPARVEEAFAAWKSAIINHQAAEAMAYLPGHVDDYLKTLNASPMPVSAGAIPPASNSPGVDHLLRTALEKKVPADLRANLTLAKLIQRISDRHLISTREVQQIDLGRVSVNGNMASAEVYYQGTLTALRLPFIKEDGRWKIDVMAILPYAEVLMRVDRAIKGETETQQVDQLVSNLPSL
jgi:hypothetical protein